MEVQSTEVNLKLFESWKKNDDEKQKKLQYSGGNIHQ